MHQQRHWNTRLTSLQEYFKDDTMAMIGYGSQGHGQGLNLRDNGLNVIVGVRKDGTSWKEAVQDGWQPGVNLFEIDEAVQKGTIVMNLLSDAAQKETWSHLKPMLTKGKVSQKIFPGTLAPKYHNAQTNIPCRPSTSPTVSPPSSRTAPTSRSPPTLT
jgi:ketol-acid reductoisomerase